MNATTTLAALMPAPHRPIELRELPLPELEPDSALLRITCSEVCGTDVHLHEGRLAGVPYPIIPGHVSVGVLERIRGDLRDVFDRPLMEGRRVTFLDVHRTCHRCWYCLVAKAATRCPARKVYGITYGVQDGLTGGWAEHLYLKPGVRILPLDDIEDTLFMAGGCSLPTALHAVERANLMLGESVLVLGAGPVGLSTVALARLQGAGKVLCIGAPDHRLACALRMGADDTLNFTGCPMAQRLDWLLEHTDGIGPDVTIECTGVPTAVTEAMRYTRDAGRVVVVGQYTNAGDAAFNPHLDLNRKHLDIRGCWGSDFSHFFRALKVLRLPGARAAWSQVVPERFALNRAQEALDAVARANVVKALITPGA